MTTQLAGAMAAEMLRDLSRPIDVELLDATVSALYGTGSEEEVRFFYSFSFALPFRPISFSIFCFGALNARLLIVFVTPVSSRVCTSLAKSPRLRFLGFKAPGNCLSGF